MHSFMTSVLLRTPRLNALVNDPHLHPSERELRQTEQARPGEWRSIVRSNPGRHSILPHRRFAHGSNLTQVHPGDDLTSDQITTVGVGDRERIATRAIPSSKIALKIHAPKLIGRCDLREWLRVWRSTPLLALRSCEASSLKNVPEGAGHRPLDARIQLLEPRLKLPRSPGRILAAQCQYCIARSYFYASWRK